MTTSSVSTAVNTRVISADCHITEPPWVFDRVPPEHRDQAPKLVRGADGGDGWSFDGGPPKRTLGIEAMAGRSTDQYQLSGLTFEQILPGNYDGAAHLLDMTTDGVDASVVYPGSAIFVYLTPDRDLALACLQSYNDWVLQDFQAADPKRLVGLPMLPIDDGMDVTLAELERGRAAGARAFFIPGLPPRPYHDLYYEPLWSACSDADLPVTFHRTFGGKPAEADWDELVNQSVMPAGIVSRFFSGVKPLTYMIMGGVFERHPGLKMIAAEVNFGWVPFWLQTMDDEFQRQGAWADMPISRRPSEYCGRNVFVTGLDDHVGFSLMKAGGDYGRRLVEMSMFSTDYPHSVTLWPNSRKHIAELTAGMDPADTTAVLAGNTAHVYHL